ncbi:ABC transporter permease subunit [Niveispirillum sp. SYP-B3756]|uniref:ABC transporter permease n=1 Tax=Niveispirillum sp. SYP-B3756 TaxID=2662178 RepID=UPI0012911466|nr:ABC transporter permease [Niveispirillum sp. SYP-B3756]MQP67055.1 ABC transporter permease subunit [Niveispirillum sp. SYP-B3756]
MRSIASLLGRRVLQALLAALFVSSLCFFMVRFLPGDIAFDIASGRYGQEMTTQAAAAEVRAELGLDKPMAAAWLSSVSALARFDLGRSYTLGKPVWGLIREQLGHTLQLSGLAMLFSLLIGPPIGIIAALRPGGLVDRLNLLGSALLRALPPFATGIILIIIFAASLHWLPAAGHTQRGTIILPALTLALGLAAVSSRVVRSAMIDVARSAYFHFPLTKGLPLSTVVLRHGVRNMAVPVIAHLAMQFVYLIEGAIVVETLFAWPGIGHALSHAVRERDIPLIQGAVLVMAILFVLFNMVIDLVLVALDPRMRAG